MTGEAVALDGQDWQPLGLAPMFCLYAAETFRREHAEGPWAWETVFNPLHIPSASQQKIAKWVETGLRWWRRPLIQSEGGTRRFLVTIACEGGLPLLLLQRENARLSQFFRAVLENYHVHGFGGPHAAEIVARQQLHRLPASLRQEVVILLSGELIAKTTDLQQQIGDARNPIAVLDGKVPDWRSQLPLRMDDEVAETLFGGLVQRSKELAQTALSRPHWRGSLREGATGWVVEKRLHFPDRMDARHMRAWVTPGSEPKPRLRLMLHSPRGSEAVAWLTLIQGTGESAVYQREWLRRGGLVLTGGAAAETHRLALNDGQCEHPVPLQEGESWGESPWVFIERGAANEWEWLTEGSARTRKDRARVLAAHSLIPKTADTGDCKQLGVATQLGRVIYEVTGAVHFLTPEGDRYRVACRAESDSDETFVVSGSRFTGTLNPRPVYQGIPNIAVIGSDGQFRTVNGRTQWRLLHQPGSWQEGERGCRGRVWLRLIDADTGLERLRRQLDVAPKSLQMQQVIGTTTYPGRYRLRGLDGAEIVLRPGCDETVHISNDGEVVCIECPPIQRASLPALPLVLQWPGTARIELDLPYPQRGATFRMAGRPLQRDEPVPLDRLYGLSLMVQDHAGGAHFWLDGELIGGGAGQEGPRRLGFLERLPYLQSGRLETSVAPWLDRISLLLAASDDRDAQVRLGVQATGGHILARLVVSRFDLQIQPRREAHQVCVSAADLARLGPGWESRIQVEMMRLWAPSDAPVALRISEALPGHWDIPADLEPGPWWIVGRDGGWARFRPLLWAVSADEDPGDPPISRSALSRAVREPNAEEREHRLAEVLSELGRDPDHRDWPLLFEYVGLVREFPPSSLDVLRRLVCYPRTLAVALLKADDEMFDRVWSLSEQMPFSWALVSVVDWREAGTMYFDHLRRSLQEVDPTGDVSWGLFEQIRERTVARRTYWRSLCDWLQEQLFPERRMTNSELQFARHAPALVAEHIETAEGQLQGRHNAEENWPQSVEVIDKVKYVVMEQRYRYTQLAEVYRPVRCAPFVAASIALGADSASDALIFELRLLRTFDQEWFDTAYAIALTLGLAAKTSEQQA